MTSWKFFTRADEAWEAMLADLKVAERTIDIEQFIFKTDEISRRFIEVLKGKALAGVRVRMLLDAARCMAFANSSFARMLGDSGVEIRFFNPLFLMATMAAFSLSNTSCVDMSCGSFIISNINIV